MSHPYLDKVRALHIQASQSIAQACELDRGRVELIHEASELRRLEREAVAAWQVQVDQRLAAIEAALGITPPAPPDVPNSSDDHTAS
jgi:hypothetical protein